jgi:excisionase family DNA binding protein
MAQKLLTLDEAAARLGISSDALVQLIDQRRIFAIKDGGAWKFKPEEVERYLADRAGSTSGEKAYYLPGDSDESQDEGGLITDALLGGAGPSSSTVLGPASDAGLGQDSDLTLGSGSSGTGSDSDVKLVPDADLESGSGSGLKLVPNVGGTGSDLQMVDLNTGSDTFKLQDDDATTEATSPPGKPSSGVKLGGSSGKLGSGSSGKLGSGSGVGKSGSGIGKTGSGIGKSGSSGKLGAGSDLTISESGLSLGEDDDIQIGGSSSAQAMNSSKIKLSDDQQFEDDDIVLGGSSGSGGGLGSGIGDSGINLAAAADSGLSLEEPLELSGEDGVSESSGEDAMSSDDDFLLTPMLELDDQDSSDSSGSQVIALDSEAVVDDQSPTLLGSDQGVAVMGGPASQAMGPGPMMMVPATPQAQHSGFSISFLVLSFLVMALTGMMMFEMIRDIWTWDGPGTAAATIMDGIIGIIEGK